MKINEAMRHALVSAIADCVVAMPHDQVLHIVEFLERQFINLKSSEDEQGKISYEAHSDTPLSSTKRPHKTLKPSIESIAMTLENPSLPGRDVLRETLLTLVELSPGFSYMVASLCEKLDSSNYKDLYMHVLPPRHDLDFTCSISDDCPKAIEEFLTFLTRNL